MSDRRHRALILAACSLLVAQSAAATTVEYVGAYVWSLPESDFGGFSGLEIGPDGSRFHVISDRATIRWGTILRDDVGRIRGLELAGRAHLRDSKGVPLPPGRLGDSEGLAIASDGTIFVSFEGLNRVARYSDVDGPAQTIESPAAWKEMRTNEGFEALAIDADGSLFTLPEHPPEGEDFPVWRYRNEGWDQPFSIPASRGWAAVGADITPDRQLYLLERNFRGVLGFRSRVRRFSLADDAVSGGEVLLVSDTLQYDNLEGISVWQDGASVRITLISDDNFLPVQRTELVEYRVTD